MLSLFLSFFLFVAKSIDLTRDAEEVATFFAGVIGTPYADNTTFQKNFFTDFKKVLEGTSAGKIIKSFEKCDFTPIADHLFALKESRKTRTKEEKEAEKKAKDEIQEKYGFCKLDNRKEKVGNFRVEPPGLFRGRGEHPKTGCLKTRVQPEQVTINLSKGAPVPMPPPGHTWAKVIHDNEVTWLANWVENVNGEIKYVFLAAGSVLKGKSDMKKFEKARELKKLVDHIRRVNKQELVDGSAAIRQRATALWLIDHLALRAGNEKGDDEADTVGCCSLRVEHIRLEKPSTVIFDFLGKDSIRYYNEVTVPDIIFKNLERFKTSKSDSESVFDTLTTSSLNSYLNKLMPGLTAKVFRTFNASFTFQKELVNTPTEGTVAEKILAYNRANRQVAVLCNHQRSVPKTHGLAMERLNDKVMALKYERQLVRKELKTRLSSAKLKARTDDLAKNYESDLDEKTMKEKALEAEEREKDKNAKLVEAGKSPTKPTLLENMADDKLEKKFESLRDKIAVLRTQMIDKASRTL
jgi:DNA topoisomerase-1